MQYLWCATIGLNITKAMDAGLMPSYLPINDIFSRSLALSGETDRRTFFRKVQVPFGWRGGVPFVTRIPRANRWPSSRGRVGSRRGSASEGLRWRNPRLPMRRREPANG